MKLFKICYKGIIPDDYILVNSTKDMEYRIYATCLENPNSLLMLNKDIEIKEIYDTESGETKGLIPYKVNEIIADLKGEIER